MRILLWHGYLLGGTGSNVYTRQLAREWSRAGHDVTVLSQEPQPERYDLGGAERVRPDVGGLLPDLRPRPLRGVRGQAPPGLHARRARPLGRGERGRRARAPSGRPRLLQPRAARRAGRRGDRRALRGQGARLGARVLDARAARARGVGTRGARAAPRRSSSARRTSATVLEEVVRPRRARARGSAGRRRRRVAAAASRGGARGARSPSAAPTRRTPGTRTSACPTRATRERLEAFLGGGRADGRLLREAAAEQGRPRAARRAPWDRRARGDRRASATTARRSRRRRTRARPVHRAARAPAPRAPAGARGRVRRAVDLPGGVRDGRGGGRGRRLPAARRASFRARRDRRRARGGVPAAQLRAPHVVRDRRRRRPAREAHASCSRCPPADREARLGCGPASCGRALELGERRASACSSAGR